MSDHRDTLWRLHAIGGADLALRYVEIAKQSSSRQSRHSEPNRDLEIAGISFYEGQIHSGPGTPNFSYRFPRSAATYINYWANLRHGWQYGSFDYKLTARYFKPDGTLMGESEYKIVAHPERQYFWHSGGLGWKDPGLWKPGEYRVELVIDHLRSKSETFTILDDEPRLRSAFGDNIALLSRPGPKGVLMVDKDQSKGLGFEGWLNKLSTDFSAAREEPRFDASKPLDAIGKMRALMSIDQRYMLAMASTRPGRVNREVLAEIENIALDYQALLQSGPPTGSVASLYSEQSVRAKIGDAFSLAAHSAETLRDLSTASRHYKAAIAAYKAAGNKQKAEQCETERARLNNMERGNINAEIKRLRKELSKTPGSSIAAARVMTDLAIVYSNNGDDTEALQLLGQAEKILEKISPDPTGNDLASALTETLTGIMVGKSSAGPTSIDIKMQANELYRRMFTAYARIYETSDPEKAAEYRARAARRDNRQTNDEFSQAMLQALKGRLGGL